MSTIIQVRVKWGKEKLEGVALDTNEPPLTFKTQLFSLTGVPVERQKVMIAGTTIGDDDWGRAASKIRPNCMLMLMGSAGKLPEPPKEPTKFIEDMTDAELSSALDVPVGLRNLGNTCYMNATVQCLKSVPELRQELREFDMVTASDEPQQMVTVALSVLYKTMDRGHPDIPLIMFVKKLIDIVPHFGEKDEKTGVYKQQDAHECWMALVNNLAITLSQQHSEAVGEASRNVSFMERYFGLKLQTKYKCAESADEMETMETEKQFQVSCFMGQDVKYLHTGIQKGLHGEIQKMSPSLNRDAVYHKSSLLSRIPAYLTVQLMRFEFGIAASTDEHVSRKILKDIKFTMKLDVYDFCTPELQSKLLPVRAKYKQVEDAKMVLKAKLISQGPAAAKKAADEKLPTKYKPYSFEDDPGSNNSGFYELIAVLTHKGRSSSSGHYLGWIRHVSGHWIKYDDDDVTMVTEEEVLKLSGGGDWHTAYVLLYGPKKLEILPQ